jgi:hypothetical protein
MKMNRCVKRKPLYGKEDTSMACWLPTCGGRRWTEEKPTGFIRPQSHVSQINAMEKIDRVAFKKIDTMGMLRLSSLRALRNN